MMIQSKISMPLRQEPRAPLVVREKLARWGVETQTAPARRHQVHKRTRCKETPRGRSGDGQDRRSPNVLWMHIVSIWHGCGSRSLYSGTEVVHPSGESAAGAFNVACWLPLIIKPVKRQVVNVLAYQACRSPNQRLSMNIRKKYEFHNDSVLQSVYTIRSGNVCRRG